MSSDPLYKICSEALWAEAQEHGSFRGAPVDLADGFVHLSSAAQAAETARLHFTGQHDLVLLAVSPASLGDALRWETSRGGALFPHVYGALPLDAVLAAAPFGADANGTFIIPDGPAFAAIRRAP